jgi:hypothetical protein
MTDQTNSPRTSALQELAVALDQHRLEQTDGGSRVRAPENAPAHDDALASEDASAAARVRALRRWQWRLPFNPWFMFERRHPLLRRVALAAVAVGGALIVASGFLAWRLSSGPIALDLATPWLTSAIEQNFGNKYRIEVGGTQLERDPQGRTALRLRDLTVRDVDGVLVAVAPKAEVGLSSASVLMARPRAHSFRLVDANVLVRIENDGRVNVFAGGERPLATIAPEGLRPQASVSAPASTFSLQSAVERSAATELAAALAWIDGVGGRTSDGSASVVTGFDGADLTEIGISNGGLTIDDRRRDRQWKYSDISLVLLRPRGGGTALSVSSESQERPWVFNVALTPGRQGNRLLQLQARKVMVDDLLALKSFDMPLRSDTLVSAGIEGEIATDGTPQTLAGTIVAEGGSIRSAIGDSEPSIPITNMEFGLDWDRTRGSLRVPIKLAVGAMRTTLRAEFAAPTQPGTNWVFAAGGGWILLDPLTPDEEGLVLKRVVVRGQIDTESKRVLLDQVDIGTKELGSRDTRDVSFAISGNFDYGDEPRLALGIAGNQMTASSLKRVWPIFAAPKVRDWVLQHIMGGTIDRLEIATNTPLATLQPGGPPIPEDGLSVIITGNGAVLRPVEGLPTIRDAEMNVRITGRTATVTLGKGVVEVSPGRRMAVSGGVFEVPDTHPKSPPARVRFRLEGSAPAAAELLALERLRDFSGTPFDPTTTRGNVSAQIALAMPLRHDLPPGSTRYNIAVDLTNFSAEKMVLGQKVEAAALRVTANNQSYQIRGDVKVNGTPAQIDYRKAATDTEAELRLLASLDEAARARLGLDVGTALVGTLPVKLTGRLGASDKESRFNVEADLTPTKIDGLLPGWVKPSGKPARAAFTLVKDRNATRFDDLLIDGQGILIKGAVELDGNGDLQAASFPVFATSDGDKATVKAERGPDGALRVSMRGDVYDGRNFVKTAMSGPSDPKVKAKHPDLDLDIKISVVAGYHGEALRGLDLRMSRRAGRVRALSLNAKIGRDTPLIGDMRTRVANGRQVIYFETNDAGALFRFTDVYPRMIGGRMWIGMDPPNQDGSAQDGVIQVRDFAIRGETALDRVVSNAPQNQPRAPVDFTQARADFNRVPGKMTIRDGVVRGPTIGATVEGTIDYSRDDVSMRGTLVPLYGLNNMFGQIPIVGLFLGGGSNEGLLGITYEVTGPTSNPRPVVNPLSAVAPGLLRKFFEFRDPNAASSFAEPQMR